MRADDKGVKFLILVVNYKMRLTESTTINSLFKVSKHLKNSNVLVWDNGPDKAGETDLNELNDKLPVVEYIYSEDNKGLSYIYNYVINNYLNQDGSKYDYLILFDNDSTFEDEFFIKVTNSICNNSDINLFTPIFKHQDIIISPADLFFIRMKRWKSVSVGKLKVKNKFAINSGMVINCKYLLNKFNGYDERVEYYGTDDDFISQYSKDNEYFFVVDYYFNHDFSMFTEITFEKELFRFKERKKAYKYIYSTNCLKKTTLNIYLFLISIKLAFKYKKIDFIGC